MRLVQAFATLALVGLAGTAPAGATGEILEIITEADTTRLEAYDATLAAALKQARAGGSDEDVATVEAVLDAQPLPFEGYDLTGDWQCRTMKLGGLSSLIVYGWFRCEVSDDGSGWRLDKISGSQRTVGRFYTDSATRLTYLGSFYVAGETPKPYGSGPESDQAGHASRTGEDSWMIGLPDPYYESDFDILELRRR